ncbi:MAG: glycosyltransferase family 39 protein [Anaerolineae bacterium]|nr:glycosyltransferase family 39 protein [Anaerolineae bacterium]
MSMKTGAIDKREALLLGGILVLALLLRLVGIDRVPPGVRYDELMNLRMAERVLAGERPIYFEESWGHEPLYHYLQALSLAVLGKTALGLRFVSVLSGVLTVFATYLIARHLFGPAIAVVSSLLLACSFWSLMLSRFGLRIVGVAPWTGLAACAFWRGLETPKDKPRHILLWFGLCGLCQAIMLYTYFAGWMMPALFGVFTLYMALVHRSRLQGRWIGLALCVILPLLLVSPMLVYVIGHPEIGQRVGQVGSKIGYVVQTQDPGPLLKNVWHTLQMFSFRGDKEWLYNIRMRPVFDPLTSLLFYGGVLLALWHWHKPRTLFCFLWLAAGVAPTMVTWPSGSLPHSVVALPATYLLLGLAVVAAYRWTKALERKLLRWSILIVLAGVLLLSAGRDGYDYFVRWPLSPQVRKEYLAPAAAAARYLDANDDGLPVAISAPFVDYWSPWSKVSFDLLRKHPDHAVRWFNGTQSVLFPAGAQVRFILTDYMDPVSELDAELYNLVVAGSERIVTGFRDWQGTVLEVYRFQDRTGLQQLLTSCASMPVWASAEDAYQGSVSQAQRQALALPLRFSDRLLFLGYTVDRERVASGEPWRLVTCWRVLDANSDPLAIFVHVLDDGNAVRASRDELGVSTAGWQPGDTLIHVHHLSIPADLDGAQRVELGVYSPVTLERLPLYTGSDDQSAPHSRVLLNPLDVQ